MDERDLYVPENAGKAELHPIYNEPSDLDEFDPLVQHHNLETVPEQKPVDFSHHDVVEGQLPSKPKQDDSEKTDVPEHPVDRAGEEIIKVQRHSPLTIKDNDQSDYNVIGELTNRSFQKHLSLK